MLTPGISKQTLRRLPFYLSYLKSLRKDMPDFISATAIADALKLNQVQVRKDLAFVSSSGRPKVGYRTQDLISEIESFLGYNETDNAIIVGAGRLGKALMNYEGFKEYGLNILAAFDTNADLVNTEGSDKPIMPMNKLRDFCVGLKIRIGIITVPSEYAQDVCDALVGSGVLAIWNFAPVHLRVPEYIIVQNENMASSLAVLSNHLNQKLSDKNILKVG
ncbi:MAG: redox-sensing transcriptional repressor Rex [Anaerolineae bacterium]|nr:redox-sensing transcriptional repressor Rex [Anaerolineae bacterium]